LLNISYLSGQEKEPIRIEQITPQLSNGQLLVSAVSKNLFSQKIVGTIQSGLPAIIQIEIKLMERGDKLIARQQITRTISYNLWEERYVIHEDTAVMFTDFEKAQAFSSRLDTLAVIARSQLKATVSYYLQIRVGIVPISASQSEKVTAWLLDPNQTEERLASEERASGFKLNLNNLISFFVSGKKKSQYNSEWFSSRVFRLVELERE
jgi:hypothetical protein